MRLDRNAPSRPPIASLDAAGPSTGTDPFASELHRFRTRTAGSLDELERPPRYLPAGVCTNFRVMEPHSIFLRVARGAHVWDVDGNEYVDYGLAQSTLLTGHAHPLVLDAVRRQIENGSMTR